MPEDRRIVVAVLGPDWLYHGCVEGDRPTPSGFPRPTIRLSTKDGFRNAADAVAAVAEAFPELAVPDVGRLPDLDPLPDLPRGASVTIARPKGGSDAPWVECRGVDLDLATALRLVEAGRLVEESSSGNDPALSARYDHFVPAAAA